MGSTQPAQRLGLEGELKAESSRLTALVPGPCLFP